MKSRLSRELGTSHTEFSLLISAFSLNSTWTPLLGGLMASRLGTTFTSILATGIILIGVSSVTLYHSSEGLILRVGQILLLIGDIVGSVRLMALGMFVFGLGVSPGTHPTSELGFQLVLKSVHSRRSSRGYHRPIFRKPWARCFYGIRTHNGKRSFIYLRSYFLSSH